MRQTSFAEMSCSLSRSLEIVGDWWSPLILRDVYLGLTRFDELATDLGISRGLLTQRLTTLVDGGVLERVPYSTRPERSSYELTAAGRELVPLLVALTQWGDRWRSPDGPPIVFSHDCGAALIAEVRCRSCGEVVTSESTTPAPGPGGRTGPGTMLVARALGVAS